MAEAGNTQTALCAKCCVNLRYSRTDKAGKQHLSSYCSACHVAATKAWSQKNRNRVRETNRKWWNEHREYQRERRARLKAEKKER